MNNEYKKIKLENRLAHLKDSKFSNTNLIRKVERKLRNLEKK